MNYSNTKSHATATRIDGQDAGARATQASLYQCLVLSKCEQRSQALHLAAQQGGWDPVVYQDAAAATELATRYRLHLAIVDLEDAGQGTPAGYSRLVERLAAPDGPLLVVCGHDGDALEEIWAHQLGVWLYLPGVAPESDVGELCREARRVVEKLYPDAARQAESRTELRHGFHKTNPQTKT